MIRVLEDETMTIEVDGGKFLSACASLLQSRSGYFRALLSSSMKESETRVLKLSGFSEPALLDNLRLMAGEACTAITIGELKEVVKLAEYLMVDDDLIQPTKQLLLQSHLQRVRTLTTDSMMSHWRIQGKLTGVGCRNKIKNILEDAIARGQLSVADAVANVDDILPSIETLWDYGKKIGATVPGVYAERDFLVKWLRIWLPTAESQRCRARSCVRGCRCTRSQPTKKRVSSSSKPTCQRIRTAKAA